MKSVLLLIGMFVGAFLGYELGLRQASAICTVEIRRLGSECSSLISGLETKEIVRLKQCN